MHTIDILEFLHALSAIALFGFSMASLIEFVATAVEGRSQKYLAAFLVSCAASASVLLGVTKMIDDHDAKVLAIIKEKNLVEDLRKCTTWVGPQASEGECARRVLKYYHITVGK